MPVLDYSVAVFALGTTEPLSVSEVLRHSRIDGAEDDPVITDLITQARIQVEHDTRRTFLSHTFDFKYDCFPSDDHIHLPRTPLVSVTHVKYYDTDGTLQTWSSANYEVDTARDTIWRAYNVDWPSSRDIQNAIQIRAVFGHVSADEELKWAKRAMLLLISHWYEHREATITGTISKEIELSYTSIVGSIERRSYP